MPVVVSLEKIVAAMDVPNSEWQCYLDPESGEIVTLTEGDLGVIDEEASELEPEPESTVIPRSPRTSADPQGPQDPQGIRPSGRESSVESCVSGEHEGVTGAGDGDSPAPRPLPGRHWMPTSAST